MCPQMSDSAGDYYSSVGRHQFRLRYISAVHVSPSSLYAQTHSFSGIRRGQDRGGGCSDVLQEQSGYARSTCDVSVEYILKLCICSVRKFRLVCEVEKGRFYLRKYFASLFHPTKLAFHPSEVGLCRM